MYKDPAGKQSLPKFPNHPKTPLAAFISINAHFKNRADGLWSSNQVIEDWKIIPWFWNTSLSSKGIICSSYYPKWLSHMILSTSQIRDQICFSFVQKIFPTCESTRNEVNFTLSGQTGVQRNAFLSSSKKN